MLGNKCEDIDSASIRSEALVPNPVSASPTTDPEVVRELAPHLAPDERLSWAARPCPVESARVRPRLVLFGAFWLLVSGGAFFGFARTFLGPEFEGVSLPLRVLVVAAAAAPFAAVGLFGIGGHVVLLRRAARRTAHGLTDRRVLSVRPALWLAGPDVTACVPLHGAVSVRVLPVADEVGHLEVVPGSGGDGPIRLGFVPQAARVAQAVREACNSR